MEFHYRQETPDFPPADAKGVVDAIAARGQA